MAAFSTPFWMTVAGAAALAASVAYLARPQEGERLPSSAQVLGALPEMRATPGQLATSDDDDTAPASAAGAARDASPFTIDALGRLVVSGKTLAVMDSWLASARGEPGLAGLEPRLRSALPPLAAERAWGLIRNYAAYRQAERELLADLKSQAPLSARALLEQTMVLRRRHFDSVSVQELFGVQEARGLYTSEVARILADATLSEAQQSQRIQALRMGLPPEVAAQEFGGADYSFALEKTVAQMREQGQSEAEVVYRRKQFVEVEGAKSALEIENEQLEAQKQAWALRHPGFVRQRNEILAADLEPDDLQRQLDQLMHQQLTPDELAEAQRHGYGTSGP